MLLANEAYIKLRKREEIQIGVAPTFPTKPTLRDIP